MRNQMLKQLANFAAAFKLPFKLRYAVAAGLLAAAPAWAVDPDAAAAALSEGSDAAIMELNRERQYGGLDDAAALRIIRAHISPLFNFERLTQRAMGKYWRRTTDGERADLTAAFRGLLETTYAKLIAQYSGQEVEILDSRARPGNKAGVALRVSDGARAVTMEYEFTADESGAALVTDIKVEGISWLANYRRQFAGVLRRDGVDGLLEKLRELNAKNRQ